MLKPILAATAFAALSSFISMQAQTADPRAAEDRIVDAVTLDDVRAIVGSYGHTIVEDMTDANGVVVKTPNGFKYLVILKVCGETQACEGVLIGSIHDLPAGTTWDIINRADMQMDAFGLYIANNQLVIDRYMILSGGVRVESFKHEIGSLIISAPPLVRSIGQLVAVETG